ncbi:MAG: hypothetical protein KIT22_03690 [Verrucomicrobiae bacterium]|nr:hypothetical protein [Verrucomicrobiae bacterium]
MNTPRFTLRQLLNNAGFTAAVVILLGVAPQSEGMAADPVAPPLAVKTRPFRMGFTAFPPDITATAVHQTREFVRTNADLIAHHIEGVPWAEALRDEPFPKELMNDRETKRSMTPPGAKVYLAISPGRGDLKPAEKGATPLPPELRGKSYDDPLVQKAYLNYCRRSLEFFQPDYLAIGIEVNEIFSAGKDQWRAYAELHRHVYRELKKEHPCLPIFASYTLHNLIKERGEMLKGCLELMPFNDFVAVSFYPFFISETPDAAFRWLTDHFDSTGKPYAMVETNDTAERTEMPKMKVTLPGTPEKQAAYVRTLLALAEQRRFQFVVLFIHQDYDPLWDAIQATAPELFMAWRDCGLIDERGQARPSYAVWRQFYDRPMLKANDE